MSNNMRKSILKNLSSTRKKSHLTTMEKFCNNLTAGQKDEIIK